VASIARRTALIVAVPEAEPAVGALRLAHDSSAALGVPAHVTILFPFAPPAAVDEDALEALVAEHAAFEFELATIEHWPQPLTYLAPVPAEPFLALMNAVWRRWPAYPPYEGVHETVIPHLTVGEAELEVDAELPIRCHAHEVLLIEEDDAGRWSTRRSFPLALPQGVA
jgi:2'-5' RNA ligase